MVVWENPGVLVVRGDRAVQPHQLLPPLQKSLAARADEAKVGNVLRTFIFL